MNNVAGLLSPLSQMTLMASTARSGFPSPAEGPATPIDRLRHQLSAAPALTGLAGACGAPLALGIPMIDGALGGGLPCGMLHEIAAIRETETAAATGFVLALTARR